MPGVLRRLTLRVSRDQTPSTLVTRKQLEGRLIDEIDMIMRAVAVSSRPAVWSHLRQISPHNRLFRPTNQYTLG